jgi:hypothetical protein
LGQYPEWHDFASQAARFTPTEQQKAALTEAVTSVAQHTRTATDVASPEVISAFNELAELNGSPETRSTGHLSIKRSFDNYVKTNVAALITWAKSAKDDVSTNQARYLKYIKVLLASVKAYVKWNDSLQWLLPVIQWIEDVIKQLGL